MQSPGHHLYIQKVNQQLIYELRDYYEVIVDESKGQSYPNIASNFSATPSSKKLPNFCRLPKFSLILKEAEVLPKRLPNFGKGNNFVF